MCAAQKLFNFPSLNTILVGLGLGENETLVKVAEHSFIIEPWLIIGGVLYSLFHEKCHFLGAPYRDSISTNDAGP